MPIKGMFSNCSWEGLNNFYRTMCEEISILWSSVLDGCKLKVRQHLFFVYCCADRLGQFGGLPLWSLHTLFSKLLDGLQWHFCTDNNGPERYPSHFNILNFILVSNPSICNDQNSSVPFSLVRKCEYAFILNNNGQIGHERLLYIC